MKKLKRLAAVLSSLAIAILFTVPAFAQEGSYSITINNTNANHTYTAYQIFRGDISDGAEDGTTSTSTYVLANIKWGSGVQNTGSLIAALKAKEGFASLTDQSTAADVAKLLDSAADLETFLTFLSGDPGYLSGTTSGTVTPEAEADSCTIELAEAGYYLVTDSLADSENFYNDFVSDYIVQVLGQEAMNPKGDKPSIEKKVYEDSLSATTTIWGNGYNDVADYNIGDAVPFKIVASIPDMSGYDGYEFLITDTLSPGLTLNEGTIRTYVTSARDSVLDSLTPLTEGTEGDYTMATTEIGNASFTLTFKNMEDNTDLTGRDDNYIIVTYTATLNDNAVIGLDGNANKVDLTYSNDPNSDSKGKTPEDHVVVFTYGLDSTKVDGGNSDTKLKGAEFVLLNSNGTQVAKVSADGKFDGWVNIPSGTGDTGAIIHDDWTAFNEINKVIMTSAESTGTFGVSGLDEGTYLLREIKAPEGYNLLEDDLALVIVASTGEIQNYNGTASSVLISLNVKVDETEPQSGNVSNGVVALQVANNAGTTLPETGGIGTTIFFVLGGVLVVGAGVLLIVRFRMRAANKE